MDLIFNADYCNTLLNTLSDYIYEHKQFVFYGKKMPPTMHSARKMAKYYIKCIQIKSAIHVVLTTPYLEKYITSLRLLDHDGYVHSKKEVDDLVEPMTLHDVYTSAFTQLESTIQTYKEKLQSIHLTKITFKKMNHLCIQVKQIIKEFHEQREKLFKSCVHALEALIEQYKLEKIINKIKELEAKKILKKI
jgi:hypothetical protein